jgi:hypothetical protein
LKSAIYAIDIPHRGKISLREERDLSSAIGVGVRISEHDKPYDRNKERYRRALREWYRAEHRRDDDEAAHDGHAE